MLYFDNAATSGTHPESVIAATTAAVKLCANPGRGAHALSLACAEEVRNCRVSLSRFFDAETHERVIFTKNCTEALNIALLGVLEQGDKVITTCMEHNSVLRPLHFLHKSKKITYDICPLQNGKLDYEWLAKKVKKDTKAVVITAASNVTGMANDLKKIKSLLPENTLFIVDGAQGGGHFPIKMRETGIDALCLAGHKGLLGLQGSGALLFSSRISPKPLMHGGTGSESYSLDTPDFYPDALEAGTLSFPAVKSLLEGVRYLTVHAKEISARLYRLTAALIRALKCMRAYRVYSVPNTSGIVAFSFGDHPSEYVSMLLSQKYGIATRGGLHCAPLMHKALGTSEDGLVRVSFGFDNTERQLDALIFALKEIAGA